MALVILRLIRNGMGTKRLSEERIPANALSSCFAGILGYITVKVRSGLR